MIIIPFALNDSEYNVFVAIQPENWNRMKKYDPAQLQVSQLPAEFRNLRLMTVIIGFATDDDVQHVLKIIRGGKVREALEFLSRGFAFRPEAGDHDGPPMSLRTEGEPKQ